MREPDGETMERNHGISRDIGDITLNLIVDLSKVIINNYSPSHRRRSDDW